MFGLNPFRRFDAWALSEVKRWRARRDSRRQTADCEFGGRVNVQEAGV